MNTIYGIVPPTVTPFDANGKIDETLLRNDLDYPVPASRGEAGGFRGPLRVGGG